MKRICKAWWIAPLCVFLTLTLLLGGVLAVRGDLRYLLMLRMRRYDALAWQAGSPSTEKMALSLLLQDSRVCQGNFLLLINSSHALPSELSYPLTAEGNKYRMHPIASAAFSDLQKAVLEVTGEELLLRSAYRSAEEQDLEWENGGDSIAARAGYSEHETGLALDVCVSGFGGSSFLKTRAGRLINDRCYEHGFLIRYPLGKSEVTGFSYEPWHLRYVGVPHAQKIMEAGLTLEEYLDALTPDVWYQSDGYYVLRTDREEIDVPIGFVSCEISFDNLGYRVLTFHVAS